MSCLGTVNASASRQAHRVFCADVGKRSYGKAETAHGAEPGQEEGAPSGAQEAGNRRDISLEQRIVRVRRLVVAIAAAWPGAREQDRRAAQIRLAQEIAAVIDAEAGN